MEIISWNLINSIVQIKKPTNTKYWVLLVITVIALFVGSVASSLLSKFYFVRGGSSIWVITWVQSAGFPLLLLPIYVPYLFNKSKQPTPFSLFTPKLFVISFSIGLMVGFSNFLFSWATSILPASTSSLLLSSQLAFNLVLSVILVKQKIYFFNLNAVILITLGSILLALDSNNDRPKGVTQAQYFWGFLAILGGGLIFALYLPLSEIVYKKVHSYEMVMEMQFIMQVAAQLIAIVGMLTDHGFGKMAAEAKVKFHGGPMAYWVSIGFTLLVWQMSFMGTAGLVYLTKSLTGGVCMTALLPLCVIGGVLAFGDKFDGSKAISTLMCVWGFCSYVYGEYTKSTREEKEEKKGDEEMKTMTEDEHTRGEIA